MEVGGKEQSVENTAAKQEWLEMSADRFTGANDETLTRSEGGEIEMKISPKNVCELIQKERLQPDGDYSKYEQTRQDAIALQGTLWAGRDFIHDRRPGIYGLFSTMVDMYDAHEAGNNDSYKEARAKLEQIVDENRQDPQKYGWTGFDGELALDINNYNDESVEVLRRLRDNTEVHEIERPKTGDETIDSLIDDIDFNKSDNNIYVDLHDAGLLAKELNKKLIESQGMSNISRDLVKALLFSDEVSTFALRSLSEREKTELPFDPDFKEIVRFSELTANPKPYSNEQFESFWSSLENDFARNWNEGANYDKLTIHIINNVSMLAKQYREEAKPDFMIDSLWSGNLVHELISLTDKK